ncbi:DnaJ chaperone [Penicillium brasilianum]|uniref:DnaJ chaperone n=1 Tax=Penicillium brasilianum TaxID=104259 RepID=A0A1S9REQ8_PENBI|nr:DnaJ chaperone [Penicillium brasilianum]
MRTSSGLGRGLCTYYDPTRAVSCTWYGDERDPDLGEIANLVNLREGLEESDPWESKCRWLGERIAQPYGWVSGASTPGHLNLDRHMSAGCKVGLRPLGSNDVTGVDRGSYTRGCSLGLARNHLNSCFMRFTSRCQKSQITILGVSSDATQPQIRSAYKRESLKSHPDRVPADSPERPARTQKFQEINDAYFTLSDPTRRREYDETRAFEQAEEEVDEEIPQGGRSFPWSAFGFGSRDERDSEQFGSVFEEMLREEGLAEETGDNGNRRTRPTGRFWAIVGGVSGGALGFIVGNVPGALAGAVAGNRLGAVRDAKGKSVYEVFLDLPQPDRTRLLSELAAKVFQSTMGR